MVLWLSPFNVNEAGEGLYFFPFEIRAKNREFRKYTQKEYTRQEFFEEEDHMYVDANATGNYDATVTVDEREQ